MPPRAVLRLGTPGCQRGHHRSHRWLCEELRHLQCHIAQRDHRRRVSDREYRQLPESCRNRRRMLYLQREYHRHTRHARLCPGAPHRGAQRGGQRQPPAPERTQQSTGRTHGQARSQRASDGRHQAHGCPVSGSLPPRVQHHWQSCACGQHRRDHQLRYR